MDNNTSLGIALLDIGTGFAVLNKFTKHVVPYGTFALALINADYGKIRTAIADTIHGFFNKGFNPDDTKEFVNTLRKKIGIWISCASTGFLYPKQARMVTNLLVREILNKIEAEHFEITDIEKCMPVIFSNPQLRNSMTDILKRTSSDLSFIMQETGVSVIDSELINMDTSVYYLNTTADYLLLDLKMYMERSDKTVKACERCSRLFLPSRKSDKYCRLPSIGSRKTCARIMHISPNDEFAKARNRARDKQHKQIRYHESKGRYGHDFLYGLYYNWSDECGKKCIEYKRQGDIDGFKAWIEETKFTAKRLSEISEQHSNDTA